MRVHINIAAGYKRGELNKWFDDNPDTVVDPTLRAEAVKQWVEIRYGSWLTSNDITEFSFYGITDDSFRIDFLHDSDAIEFVSTVGGRVVEE